MDSRYILEHVIRQLFTAWTRPSVWESLRPHLIALSPEVSACSTHRSPLLTAPLFKVFPKCYQWATYSVCLILEQLFREEKKRVDQNPTCTADPHLVEFTSSLERALAYATTGNGKVLHRSTMGPLLLSKGILRHGFPALDSSFWVRSPAEEYRMSPSHWPVTLRTGEVRPLSSALNGLKYHYHHEAAMVVELLLSSEIFPSLRPFFRFTWQTYASTIFTTPSQRALVSSRRSTMPTVFTLCVS